MFIPDNPIVETHIKNLPASVQPVYKSLRKLGKAAMPGAVEMLYHNALGYSLTESPWDRVCYIAHQPKGYVNFGFFFGADLPDPTKLREANGKRIRHVRVYDLKGAKDPALEKLVKPHGKRPLKTLQNGGLALKEKKIKI